MLPSLTLLAAAFLHGSNLFEFFQVTITTKNADIPRMIDPGTSETRGSI